MDLLSKEEAVDFIEKNPETIKKNSTLFDVYNPQEKPPTWYVKNYIKLFFPEIEPTKEVINISRKNLKLIRQTVAKLKKASQEAEIEKESYVGKQFGPVSYTVKKEGTSYFSHSLIEITKQTKKFVFFKIAVEDESKNIVKIDEEIKWEPNEKRVSIPTFISMKSE